MLQVDRKVGISLGLADIFLRHGEEEQQVYNDMQNVLPFFYDDLVARLP